MSRPDQNSAGLSAALSASVLREVTQRPCEASFARYRRCRLASRNGRYGGLLKIAAGSQSAGAESVRDFGEAALMVGTGLRLAG
jgi:hypothetical protein